MDINKESSSWREMPESEYTIKNIRSSGPGGQRVNKVATARQLVWHVESSTVFSEEEKERIKIKLKNRINENDELILKAQEFRSGKQNEETIIKRLHELVNEAILVPKKRVPTRPKKSAKEKRLKEKKEKGEIKRLRAKPQIDE